VITANVCTFELYRRTFYSDRNLIEQDYLSYYTAASLPRHQLYDINEQREFQTALLGEPYRVPAGVLLFNHPPFLVPIIRLLVTKDYTSSYRRWAAVLCLLCLLCGVGVYFNMHDAGHQPLICFLSASTALLFYPLYRSVEIGTDTALALLGTTFWMLFVLRGNDLLAGLALALTCVKPHLALVLGAATFGFSRSAFKWFVVGSLALTVLSISYVGAKGVMDLLYNLKLSTNGEALGVVYGRQYNFMGILARCNISSTIVRIAGWSAFAIAIGVTAFGSLYHKNESWLGVVALASIFFSPNLHFHDLALLVLPITMVARQIKSYTVSLIFLPLSPVPILFAGWTIAGYTMTGLSALALSRTRKSICPQ